MEGQLKIPFNAPLFPKGIMDAVKAAHKKTEVEKLQEKCSHLLHKCAGHIGAYQKLKQKLNENDRSRITGYGIDQGAVY